MMRVLALVAALLAVTAVAARSDDSEKAKNPVSKVVGMLKDMSAQLTAEGEADEEAYDKMTCFCETNDKEKTKSIADAELKIEGLESTIAEMTAKSQALNTEVDALNKEIAENEAALQKASGIRAEELAEFNQDEKDMITTLGGLKGAVTSLGRTQNAAALTQQNMMSVVSSSFKDLAGKERLFKMLTHRQRKHVMSFLQQPASAGSYAPQSGAIFGILKQMKEQFEGNLAKATSEEKKSASEFASMKAAKQRELAAAGNKAQTKTGEAATADTTAADAREDLESTKVSLAADREFLANLGKQCAALDKEYSERTQTRAQEIQAVSEAIGILNDDSARDLFSTTTAGFIQLSIRTRRVSARALAVKKVMKAAVAAKDPRVSALAVSMQLDAFGIVKNKVEGMIADLETEADEEIKKRDKCTADLHENTVQNDAKEGEKADVQASLAALTQATQDLKDELATSNDEMAATMTEMQRASEDREIENKDFQETIQDQRATQQILTKALDRLKAFYAKKALIQLKAKKSTRQDPGSFATYKNHESSGGVMGMIQKVVDDSKKLEMEAIVAEQDSQAAYESFITEGNKGLAAKQKGDAEKAAVLGAKTEELVTAKGDLKGMMADLEDLFNIKNALHDDCDFLMNNFETRVQSRETEKEALRQAIAILSGSGLR